MTNQNQLKSWKIRLHKMNTQEILAKIPQDVMEKLRLSGLSDEEIALKVIELDKGE